MREYHFIKTLKNSEHTPFVTNLLCLLHNNLERAQEANNDVALAQILQEAIFYTTFNTDATYHPVSEKDVHLHQQLFEEYQNLVEQMTEKQTKAEQLIDTLGNGNKAAQRFLITYLPTLSIQYQQTARDPQSLHEAKQLARSSLALHHYFVEELKNHLKKKSIIAEYKLAYCMNIESLILVRQKLTLSKPIPASTQKFDWGFAKYQSAIQNLQGDLYRRFEICSEIFLSQTLPSYQMTSEYFKTKINHIRAAHKHACDKHGMRYGRFELLTEKISEDALNTSTVPEIETAFEEKMNKTFILQQIKPDTSYIHTRWITQLSQDASFSKWSGKSSDSATAHAKRTAVRCFIAALILTCVASLVIARITVGPIHWSNPDWDTLKKMGGWFENKLGAYLLANTLTPVVTGLVAYQWRKREYTFKQNTIMSYKAHNGNTPQ